MKVTRILALSGVLLSIPVHASADWISDLRSPDMAICRAAIDAIQTKNDPRIPDGRRFRQYDQPLTPDPARHETAEQAANTQD